MKKSRIILAAFVTAVFLFGLTTAIVAQSNDSMTLTKLLASISGGQQEQVEVLVTEEIKEPVEVTELAPGVTYTIWRNKKNLAGEELRVYALEVDINQRDVEIWPVTSGDKLGDVQTVGSMAKEYGAVGAINGSFYGNFDGRRLPQGNLIIDGNPLTSSSFYWSSIGFTEREGTESGFDVLMGYFSPEMEAVFSNDKVAINDINSSSKATGIHMYTPEWGDFLNGLAGAVNVMLLKDGDNSYRVGEVSSSTVTIPSDGLVLQFIGENQNAIAGSLSLGDGVTVNYSYDKSYWGEVKHLISAGPLLVENGEAVFQAVQEGFTGSVLEPNPRSAIGVTKEDKILLVVAERATSGSRVGLTLEEMALLMVELEADQAMGLDGGGSSTIYAEGQVVNNAKSNQRAVANGFMVLVGPKLYLNSSRIFPDVPPVITDSRTLVPIRIIMEALGARVDWEQETKTVTVTRQNKVIELVIDSTEAMVNGVPVQLDVSPTIQQGIRTMVPVRFVTENLNGSVDWDGQTRSINLRVVQ